jgi:hypothetical protein
MTAALLANMTFFFALRMTHGDQGTVVAKGPAVVGTDEAFGVSMFMGTDDRCAVRAAIHQDPNMGLVVADKDDRLSTDATSAEISGLGNFTLVPDVHPAAMKDLVHLIVEDGGVGVDAAVNAIVEHQVVIIDG